MKISPAEIIEQRVLVRTKYISYAMLFLRTHVTFFVLFGVENKKKKWI